MAFPDAKDVAEKLADRAEAVCRTYLPKGRKDGNYWMIGDAFGAPGKSTYVRLRGPLSGKGAAGRWTDAATGEHGNLLDIIRNSQGLAEFRDVMAEACRFLSLPDPTLAGPNARTARRDGTDRSREWSGRLFASSQGLAGSPAEAYLRSRGIVMQPDFVALRYHPRCFHGADSAGRPAYWPAMIGAVTDLSANLTGVSRTYLARDGSGKAPVDPQRRAKGEILGNGIRFGLTEDVMAAGEGIETTLSLRSVLPAMPLVASTSSSHLAGIVFPPQLRTLLVIRDNDHAGDAATDALFARGRGAGIEVVLIEPELDDLNSDLMRLGRSRLIERLRDQLPRSLFERFLIA